MQRIALVVMVAALVALGGAVALLAAAESGLIFADDDDAYAEYEERVPVPAPIPTAEEILAVQDRAAVCGDGRVAGYEECDCGGNYTGWFSQDGQRIGYCEKGGRTCLATCKWE